MTARTLFDKVWDAHVVSEVRGGPALLYVDLHLVHEVTSPQAFEGLRLNRRRVRRPELTVATVDHNVPTGDRRLPIADELSARQVRCLVENAREFGIRLFDLDSPEQGIVHVIGPELGLTQPGMTIVCGDSHTSTHGAFGALAFGIGTTEVEHVLATQCVMQTPPRTMEVRFCGLPTPGVSPKDLILAVIRQIGTAGATGHVIEYTGEAVQAMSMEGRMTVCNMSIEAGARSGMIAPDGKTLAYLAGRREAPTGRQWERAVRAWSVLRSDPDAHFDRQVTVDASALQPQVTWGTSPGMTIDITGRVPDLMDAESDAERQSWRRALEYMQLRPGTPLAGLKVDRVFLGSCTNARIEDLREAAHVVRGRRVASGVRAMVVPGSRQVKVAAEREGLDRVFTDAGFEWRNPGCSMCLGMNEDVLGPGERCASTSNRNFEGRQGRGGRTHLMSPIMAAAAAIAGCLVDVRVYLRDSTAESSEMDSAMRAEAALEVSATTAVST
jgi:3-isopropylmalate/(R)-2-methylmalate dehydratase large subunit